MIASENKTLRKKVSVVRHLLSVWWCFLWGNFLEVCECGLMEVRPRHGVGSNEPYRNNCNNSSSNNISFDHYERDLSFTRSSPIWRRIKREAQSTLKTFVDILTGRASKFTYVIAPVLFALFWVLICIITGSRSVSLHDRLVQSKRVSYEFIPLHTVSVSCTSGHVHFSNKIKVILEFLPSAGRPGSTYSSHL